MNNTKTLHVTSKNFPAAFQAMDEAAREFWAYPDAEWQDDFLLHWAIEHQDETLLEALNVY